MNQRALIAIAASSLLTTFMLPNAAFAQEMGKPTASKEKCYGIAKAGQNDCANLAGTHSCAGQAKVDEDKGEWKYVVKGTCNTMKGMTTEDVKKAAMMVEDAKKASMKK